LEARPPFPLAFCQRAGFETWRETDGAIAKVYTLD